MTKRQKKLTLPIHSSCIALIREHCLTYFFTSRLLRKPITPVFVTHVARMAKTPARHVWEVLEERENARQRISMLQLRQAAGPEGIFYSVNNSVKHSKHNRYSNVLAYDRTAVRVDGESYLNANVVCNGRGRWYVAAQAPPPHAQHAFFKAIFDRSASSHSELRRFMGQIPSMKGKERAAIIVQLTSWEENGRLKADPYLPDLDKERQVKFEGRTPLLLSEQSQTPKPELCAIVRRLQLHRQGDEEVMSLWHYHYEGWPDFGVPAGDDTHALRRLIESVEAKRTELGGQGCEVWVHCSAGVGRTGTFIALSTLLETVARGGPEKGISSPLGPLPKEVQADRIAQTVDHLREWRNMLVQQRPQLDLIYAMAG